MTCSVPKKDRTEYVQNLVLDVIQQIAGPDVQVTLDMSLGKSGLGHTPVKRKFYYQPISETLAKKGCAMKTLKPSDFADAKRKTVGDIASMVEKDLA